MTLKGSVRCLFLCFVTADNVSENVGDVVGVGADLFGSFVEATCAARVLIASSGKWETSCAAPMYPVLMSSIGVRGESTERFSHHQHCAHVLCGCVVVVDDAFAR